MAATLVPTGRLLQNASLHNLQEYKDSGLQSTHVEFASFRSQHVSGSSELGFQGLRTSARECSFRVGRPGKDKHGNRTHVTRASAPGLADEQDQSGEKDGNFADFPPVPTGAMMVPMMKKSLGAYGGGATLEKAKLDLSVQKSRSSAQVDLGGGSGNNGKGVFFGGGDGGDDGGDDDDYFGEGDDGDDGDDDGFIRRGVVAEVFDRASIEAVLQEWFKTMKDLPAGLARAVEMGLVSSALVVRFMSIDARPTIARVVSRMTPSEISRAFIGRMMADPAFIYKLALEQAVTVGAATVWEVQQRRERLKDEWDLALANILTLSVCNLAVTWSLAPSRSYGTTARSDWQNVLQKLPNHMFDKSYPLREFNIQSRIGSFFYKAAELSFVGTAVGAAGGALSSALLSIRRKRSSYIPSVPVPSTGTSALAFGSYAGLSGNLRYQMVHGLERVMQQNFNHLPLVILASTGLRCGNIFLAEPSRLAWLGLDGDTTEQAEVKQQAYRRPSLAKVAEDPFGQLWKFSIVSFTEQLFGLPQQKKGKISRAKKTTSPKKNEEPSPAPKNEDAKQQQRGKRKVKRRVTVAQ